MKPTQSMFLDEQPQPATRKKAKVVEEPTTSLDLPLANVLDLPSKGQFGYPASVSFRDILAKDEQILATTTEDTYARTLNRVIKAVLMDCPFYEKMTVHDRDYVLIWLWANNYSPKRKVQITCSHCGKVEDHMVDMTRLPTESPKEGFTGSHELILKTTGKPITLRMKTVGNELVVEEYMIKHKDQNFDNLMLISSIDLGMDIPLESKIKWVGENVTGKEMAIIKRFHAHYAYGVKTALEHKCSSCGGVTTFELPFSASEVFSPRLDESDEELLRFM
jgi:hypothetical protein